MEKIIANGLLYLVAGILPGKDMVIQCAI